MRAPSRTRGRTVPQATEEAPARGQLFDLRTVIALLFVVYGIVLTSWVFFGETRRSWPRPAASTSTCGPGSSCSVVGIGFYIWAFVKPPMPPELDHVDHYPEGGPLHMGHDFADLHPTRRSAVQAPRRTATATDRCNRRRPRDAGAPSALAGPVTGSVPVVGRVARV